MPTVIDDATLFAVLTYQAGEALLAAASEGNVVTTSHWYYRLHRALHDPSSAGSLSAMAARLPSDARDALGVRLNDLPPEIVVPGPRLLVPVMGALRLRRRVNFLTAEALAAALVTDGTVRVSVDAPLLRDSCAQLGIGLEVRSPLE